MQRFDYRPPSGPAVPLVLVAVALVRVHAAPDGEMPNPGSVFGIMAGTFIMAMAAEGFVLAAQHLRLRAETLGGELAATQTQMDRLDARQHGLALADERAEQQQAEVRRCKAACDALDARISREIEGIAETLLRDPDVEGQIRATADRIARGGQ